MIFELLKSAETVEDILDIIASIEGPFAFVFFKVLGYWFFACYVVNLILEEIE